MSNTALEDSMQPRTSSREFAIVLFCLLGIAVLNDFSHNKYHGVTNPIPLLAKVFKGTGIIKGYQDKTLFELLDQYAKNPKEVEGWKGVAVRARILRETATDVLAGNPTQTEKVNNPFYIHRMFSESGSDEGAHVIKVQVRFEDTSRLEPNLWVMVQGKVVPGPAAAEGEPAVPIIEATRVEKLTDPPQSPILTPQGEQEVPEMDEHAGHEH